MNPTRETWKHIAGHEGAYEVSDLGRVRSLDRHVICGRHGETRAVKGRIMKPAVKLPGGYLVLNIGKSNLRHVAHLVAEAFIGPRPAGMDVCHDDCDPTNNAATNLRYDTRTGNMADTVGAGRSSRGVERPAHRLTEVQAGEIRAKYVPYRHTARMLAEEYGVPRSTVEAVLRSNSPTWAWVD